MRITRFHLFTALIFSLIGFTPLVLSDITDIPPGAPEICKTYYGDGICDDSQQACGPDFNSNTGGSLAACKECSTGGFDCKSGGTSTSSGTSVAPPSNAGCAYTAKYYGNDGYCDDSAEKCKSEWVKPNYAPTCKECSITHTNPDFVQWQQLYCKINSDTSSATSTAPKVPKTLLMIFDNLTIGNNTVLIDDYVKVIIEISPNLKASFIVKPHPGILGGGVISGIEVGKATQIGPVGGNYYSFQFTSFSNSVGAGFITKDPQFNVASIIQTCNLYFKK